MSVDPPGIFSSFLFLGCLCTWSLIPYGGLNGRGRPEPPWVGLCTPKSCRIGGKPLKLAFPGGQCPKRAESPLFLSFPGEPPGPGEAELQKCHPETQSARSHSWYGQDRTEPRALGCPLSPVSPFLGPTDPQSLSPHTHPPTQCPLSPWQWQGPGTPMSLSPLAWLGTATCSRSPGGAGGPNPCGPAALLPRSPQNEASTPLLVGCRKLQRGRGGSGIPSGKNGTPQMCGDRGLWGAAALGKGL